MTRICFFRGTSCRQGRGTLLLWIFCLLLISTGSVCAQKATIPELTVNQKVQDFDHLYRTMRDANPYLWVIKRQKGIDWLSNYEQYRSKIEATASNLEYLELLTAILDDLSIGHLDMLPTVQYDFFRRAYTRLAESDSTYSGYVEELEKHDASENYYYWGTLLNRLATEQAGEESRVTDGTNETLENLELEYDSVSRAAIVKIRSFSYDFIEGDSAALSRFLESHARVSNLVIDIQGNGGGSTSYWSDLIVSRLAVDTLDYPFTFAFRSSPVVQRFRPDYLENSRAGELNMDHFPPEIEEQDFLVNSSWHRLVPEPESIRYGGNIYLLVDGGVFSSADTFAYFCKATGFATVAGQTTKGDGIGSDPFLLTLPESGIVIRYTGEMGLNADGSTNVEERTVPDLVLNGETPGERLEQLLHYISLSREE